MSNEQMRSSAGETRSVEIACRERRRLRIVQLLERLERVEHFPVATGGGPLSFDDIRAVGSVFERGVNERALLVERPFECGVQRACHAGCELCGAIVKRNGDARLRPFDGWWIIAEFLDQPRARGFLYPPSATTGVVLSSIGFSWWTSKIVGDEPTVFFVRAGNSNHENPGPP